MRSSLWLVAVVSLVGLGCKEATTRGVSDAGLACSENERIIDGQCQFVCDRDSDCGIGQRCNLLLGSCEPFTPPDPGPTAFPCTEGAERCSLDDKAIERCDADGQWQVKESCGNGGGYCSNGTCLACKPGSTACDAANPNLAKICKDDGSGYRDIACAGGATCGDGECRECTPGASRCTQSDTQLQACQRHNDETNSWRWGAAGDAVDGTCTTKVCQTLSPTSAQCKPPVCSPGLAQCKSDQVQQVCSDQGEWIETACTALPGASAHAECIAGVCVDECAEAAKAKSYFGCEYWTSVLDNSVGTIFKGGVTSGQGTVESDFAFAVSNRSTLPTTVEVFRHFNGAPARVTQVVVPGRNDASKGIAVIKVPWQSIGPNSSVTGTGASGLLRYGYRLTSTRPVTVYQFNPLDAGRFSARNCSSDASCTESVISGVCKAPQGQTQKKCFYNSYSNDASLLLPAHNLGTSHMVIAPEPITFPPSTDAFNTFMTVVASQDNTQVTVQSSAKLKAGTNVPAIAKGGTQTFTLNAYDVLQLSTNDSGEPTHECASFGLLQQACRVNNDLTGSVISSTKPVAVFAGSPCTYRPFNKEACDHVEEQIFPYETWGKKFVAVKSHPYRLTDGTFSSPANRAPDHYKIVASCPLATCPDGTLITLSTPPAAADVLVPNRCMSGTLATNDCRLAGGQFMEFKSKAHFTITADYPIAVAQFFTGENASSGGLFDFNPPVEGDPSFVLLPPMEQWRASYTVLAAPAIRDNYLGLAWDDATVARVVVDGAEVTGWGTVPNTTLRIKNHPISVGSHTITVVPRPGQAQIPGAGVTVYGFDSYVSYGYTGGLDLTKLVTDIKPGG